MTQRSVSHFDQIVAQYLGLEELSVAEDLLDMCGASIDVRALHLLKRRLHEEEMRATALGARGYVRMHEKCEQLMTCLKQLMPHQTPPWERNIDGLRRAARTKAETTKRRAEEALTVLLKERRSITFKAVAETAQISTAWLYANEDIKQRIIHLRSQQTPKAPVALPVGEQASNTSKDTMIAALQKRVKEQAAEIRELKRQLEVAYGQLAKY